MMSVAEALFYIFGSLFVVGFVAVGVSEILNDNRHKRRMEERKWEKNER